MWELSVPCMHVFLGTEAWLAAVKMLSSLHPCCFPSAARTDAMVFFTDGNRDVIVDNDNNVQCVEISFCIGVSVSHW